MTYEKIEKFLKVFIVIILFSIFTKSLLAQEITKIIQDDHSTSKSNKSYCAYYPDLSGYPTTVTANLTASGCTQNELYVTWTHSIKIIDTDKVINFDTCNGCHSSGCQGYWDINTTTDNLRTCYGTCDRTPPEGYISERSVTGADISECTSNNKWCGCPTSTDPLTYPLYREPTMCDAVPNSSEVDGACVCDDGYNMTEGVCVPCYELVSSTYYREQVFGYSQNECNLQDVRGDTSPHQNAYISRVAWVTCLEKCVVGVQYCRSGETAINGTSCEAQEDPEADETCRGWQRIGFLDLSGGGLDYGYPDGVTPPNCYNKYQCVDDYTQIKYVQSACGADNPDDENSDPTDPHNPENNNESDPLATQDNNNSFTGNGTSAVSENNNTSFARMTNELFVLDRTLTNGFRDMQDAIHDVETELTDGFADLDEALSEIQDGVEGTNSALSDINNSMNNLNNTMSDLNASINRGNDILADINKSLTDTRSDSNYTGFVDNASTQFSAFEGRGVLPFASIAHTVPTVSFTMHGETFTLLNPDMLSSIDWSLFRNFLLFLAAIAGFKRIFSNV